MVNCSVRAIQNAIFKAAEKLGYAELHPKQGVAERSFLKGRDVFICHPIGGGKSLRILLSATRSIRSAKTLPGPEYSEYCRCSESLIPVMKDQVRVMTERNITAVYAGDVDVDTETDGKY